MPPLNGIDPGINGEMLKVLDEIGHGSQIAVVDPSYPIPYGAEVVNYQGSSSAQALKGILDLVPVDEMDTAIDNLKVTQVICMAPDPPDTTCEALEAFKEISSSLDTTAAEKPTFIVITRNGEATERGLSKIGFYAIAKNPEVRTLFVRTRDEKAFACALFVVGHAQK